MEKSKTNKDATKTNPTDQNTNDLTRVAKTRTNGAPIKLNSNRTAAVTAAKDIVLLIELLRGCSFAMRKRYIFNTKLGVYSPAK
jgi:hypothetical protein